MTHTDRMTPRNRLHYLALILFTIAVGLFSRSEYVPYALYFWLGDMLYALMIYWILGWLYPRASIRNIAVSTYLICLLIELTQLHQSNLMLALRETTLGGLILGHEFLWTDLAAYAVGTIIGVLVERGDGRF